MIQQLRMVVSCGLIWLLASCGAPVNTRPAEPGPVSPATPKNLSRIVFLGDSLTKNWDLSSSFAGKDYINKGISGDNSNRYKARFQVDVIEQHPDAVIIWASGNGLGGASAALEEIANLQDLEAMARSNGITVIFGTATPRAGAYAFENPFIVQVNEWLRPWAEAHNIAVADYYPVLAAPDGSLRPEFTTDGLVHLNAAGYAALTPVATAAIQDASTR